MGNVDRSRKKTQLWKKALIHFSFCFAMGFFTGFAPTSTASFFSDRSGEPYNPIRNVGIIPNPIQALHKPAELDNQPHRTLAEPDPDPNPNLKPKPNLVEEGEEEEEEEEEEDENDDDLAEANPRGLLIAVTTTRAGDRFGRAGLTRLAHTLRLVPPPLMWIVVEAQGEAARTAEMLRGTGIMYRHLTFKENFTDPEAEAHHQRNVALGHLEHHRIAGVVHFAAADNVYDLQFFEEIRRIEVFGTWPVATVSANEGKILVEGPVCSSSRIVGWFSRDLNDGATAATAALPTETDVGNGNGRSAKPVGIHISGFAFNSSILWDPERWGRPTSLPDTSQDSFKFVQEVILEDETKLKGVPSDCSQIMLWHLHMPSATPLPFDQSQWRRFMDK